MQVLILGGTRFVGRHIAEAFVSTGHQVTVFTRGQSPNELPDSVELLRGDRDAGIEGLAALGDRKWDACFDVSGYTPRQVRPSAEMLRDCIRRYIFVSAVRVYGDPTERPVRETHPLLPPASEDVTEIDDETYGPLKAACEAIVRDTFLDRATILRPQVVVGPHDPSGRFTYWLNRATRGGPTLAPGDGSDHLQVIDARDLARFAARVVENGLSGMFNIAGPRLTWTAFMDLIGAGEPVWVGADVLQSADLQFGELPLYRPEHGRLASLMDVSNEKALAAGLTLTDLAVTIHDTREWAQDRTFPGGLSPQREAEFIKAALGQ